MFRFKPVKPRLSPEKITDHLRGLDDKTLKVILDSAYERNKAQIQIITASEQKGMRFFGSMVTIVTFLLGAATLATPTAPGSVPRPEIAHFALAASAGLLLAAALAFWAARPKFLYYPGNDPEAWIDDLPPGAKTGDGDQENAHKNSDVYRAVLAAECGFANQRLFTNLNSLAKSASALKWAGYVAGGTVFLCALWLTFWLLGIAPA